MGTDTHSMIEDIRSFGYPISSPILSAMRSVPRESFAHTNPFANNASRIDCGQTISQPFIVAYMIEILNVKPSHRVLEIGTGSGYSASVLSQCVSKVYSVEVIEHLAKTSTKLCKELGYTNLHITHNNGRNGWNEHAPYDRILITAASDNIPKSLIEQLKTGGELVLPLNSSSGTTLVKITKTDEGTERKEYIKVVFVPLVK